MASADRVVPHRASERVRELVGRADRCDEMVVQGSHATFGTGRSAFRHTLPRLVDWIGSHSDARPETKGSDGDQTARVR